MDNSRLEGEAELAPRNSIPQCSPDAPRRRAGVVSCRFPNAFNRPAEDYLYGFISLAPPKKLQEKKKELRETPA